MRRGSDSEEERHDRFRSERRGTLSTFASSGLDSKYKRRSPLRRLDSPIRESSRYRRRSSERRSRERIQSRERLRDEHRNENKDRRRNRSRSSSRISDEFVGMSYYGSERSESRLGDERRSTSRFDTERISKSRHSDERRFSKERRSRSRYSEERRSKSRYSEERRSKHKYNDERKRSLERNVDHNDVKRNKKHHSCKTHRRSTETFNLKQVDSFNSKFERRRSEERSEERVEKTIIYWETTPSPDREPKKHKKRSSGEKKKSKEKKKKREEKDKESDNSLEDVSEGSFGPSLPPSLELRSEASADELTDELRSSVDKDSPRKKKHKESPSKVEKNSLDKKKKKKKENYSTAKKTKAKSPNLAETDEKMLPKDCQEVDELVLTPPSEEDKDIKNTSFDIYGPKPPDMTETDERAESSNDLNKDIQDSGGDIYGPEVPVQQENNLNNPVKTGSDEVHKAVCSTPTKDQATDEESSLEEGELVSPAKPKKVYGPTLPERIEIVASEAGETGEEDTYGPVLPPAIKREINIEDDDINIGPLPEGIDGGKATRDLESRAALIKAQMNNKDITDESREVKREEWMTELPEARKAALGLGARKFRAREGPDMSDRSSWSDTPAQKEKKRQAAMMGENSEEEDVVDDSRRLSIVERDKEMEKRAKLGKKKKEKSLLDLHQKEIRKKKKKEEKERGDKKEERRPFSRELDLQTNRFDEAQKKSIIKKAQLLDSRFSTGESKYL